MKSKTATVVAIAAWLLLRVHTMAAAQPMEGTQFHMDGLPPKEQLPTQYDLPRGPQCRLVAHRLYRGQWGNLSSTWLT